MASHLEARSTFPAPTDALEPPELPVALEELEVREATEEDTVDTVEEKEGEEEKEELVPMDRPELTPSLTGS